MEQIYNAKMNELGYSQLVCDIFANWEDVKDEILIPERKTGSGNGTVHIFLGAANDELQKEFPDYYNSVNTEAEAANGAIDITHYFLRSNIISMLGYVCQYNYKHDKEISLQVHAILEDLNQISSSNILSTKSLFKLSTGSNKLRPYFKQFESNGVFSKVIRKLLLPESSYKISLYKNAQGEYAAFWLIGFDDFTDFEADANTKHLLLPNKDEDSKSRQIIYYGAPGTGKSFKGKKQTGEIDENNQEVEKKNVFRTTFHPDTDYASFVGCYKPTMKPTGQSRIINNKQEPIEEISYEFIPQVFTDAYVYAYNNPKEATYLMIEEINRGNCAQIFGDLFQLLDRKNDGTSEYTIKADKDLAKYLRTALGKDSEGIKEDKLRLPANLHILATMNTSDQSLFPMDSAFKRRWDWQYIPISYTEEKSCKFRITIGDKQYEWVNFIKAVNEKIYDITKSEDKQLGNFFIKSSVNVSQFKSKVMFYLWNEVLRDEVENPKYFFYSGKDSNRRKFSFKELFDADSNELLQGFMEGLGLESEE